MNVELNALCLGRPETRVTTGPFSVTEIDDYLPEAMYAELLASYPDPGREGHHHAMKNYLKSGTPAFDAFLAQSPSWSKLIRFMDSDEFLNHVYEYAAPSIIASRGWLGGRPWARNGVPIGDACGARMPFWWNALAREKKFVEIETGLELSAMENGHCITPHSDAEYKLVSILLYFPFQDWKAEWGGGTQFFRARDRAGENRWCNPDVNHVKHFGEPGLNQFARDMEYFHTAPFAPNHLTLFCKSNHTFHAVDAISCPPDRRRNALVLNVNMKATNEAPLLKQGKQLVRRGRRWLRNLGQVPLEPVDGAESAYDAKMD